MPYMTKYKISISIDGQNYFWMIIDRGKLIKNPNENDLKVASSISYNETNICPKCREENNITDKSILYPGNARHDIDKEGKNIEEWVCYIHYKRNHNRYSPNSTNNIIRSLAGSRTGNLSPTSNRRKGNRFEKLSEIYYGVDNLNIKNDNYNSPIDHSRHPILGIIQTMGRYFNKGAGAKGGWPFTDLARERDKKFDNLILWCANEDGNIIERGYIIPKKEINNRTTIKILKEPKDRHGNSVPLYEKYMLKDKEEMKKINDIWKEILDKNDLNKTRNK